MQPLRSILALCCVLLTTSSVAGQTIPVLNWSADGKEIYFETRYGKFLVDVESKAKQQVKTLPNFVASIPRLALPPAKSIDGGDSTKLEIKNETSDSLQVVWVNSRGRERGYGSVKPGESFVQNTFIGHAWLLKSSSGKRLGSFRSKEDEILTVDADMLGNVRKIKRSSRKRSKDQFRYARPRDVPNAKIHEHDLWIEGKQFTDDATEELTFQNIGNGTSWFNAPRGPDLRWSPNAEFVIAFQTANVPQPHVELVETTPTDQLQPKTHRFPYPKPGDDLPRKTLRLFSVEDQKEIAVSNELFQNPWSLKFVKWSEDGEKFWLHYNQRGHQVVRLVEVDASTGEARTLIEESSDTFVHYSNGAKSVFERLPNDKILWASERSGWNHLYQFNTDGKLENAVTRGDWNVKRIDHIDRENGVVWFYAVGVYPDQDPYHEHFCRVNLDGTGFKILTDGDGTHRVQFQQDGKYFIDTFSRVDLAPVSQLRDSKTGELIVELERRNTESAFGDRPLTTRFTAKGRDGETDIWGIIHWPQDFDPKATYPIVENIYAGPHDHHVPKSFRSRFFFQHKIADAGMIVVQIDGMGTAWRSKKFHDVCYKNLKDGGFPDRIAWIKAAAKKYPQMDPDRVGIYGGSAGGQNAMAALLWHNDFYKVAVADCGCHDNRMDKIWWNEQWMGWPVDKSYIENSNMENAHLLKGHLMLTVGELDRNVDPATTTQVVKKLIEHGKDFEFVLIPGAGHGAGDTPWAASKRLSFLKRHLLAEQD
jgi:dipeptidyl aminopeptidase/acylaminoacyl peptidase